LNSGESHIDAVIVEKLIKGDKQAFKDLFDKYGTRLYQFSIKYLRDKEETEDLLNEVFLKIWENRINLRSDKSFQSYLFTIAYNNIRQRFLKKSREEKYIQIFAEEYLIASGSEDSELDYNTFVEKMNKVIQMLPARRREIFILSYKEEKKNGEIAENLGVSEQFVKKQLGIARKFVVEKMKSDSDLAGILFLTLFSCQIFD